MCEVPVSSANVSELCVSSCPLLLVLLHELIAHNEEVGTFVKSTSCGVTMQQIHNAVPMEGFEAINNEDDINDLMM